MTSPDWNQLYHTAAAREGYFTTQRASKAGYSRPLLQHHLHARRLLHPR